MDLIVGGILKRDLKSGVDNLLWLIIISFVALSLQQYPTFGGSQPRIQFKKVQFPSDKEDTF